MEATYVSATKPAERGSTSVVSYLNCSVPGNGGMFLKASPTYNVNTHVNIFRPLVKMLASLQ